MWAPCLQVWLYLVVCSLPRQDNYERLCEREVDHIALESALRVFREQQDFEDEDSSDVESFVSATDVRTEISVK